MFVKSYANSKSMTKHLDKLQIIGSVLAARKVKLADSLLIHIYDFSLSYTMGCIYRSKVKAVISILCMRFIFRIIKSRIRNVIIDVFDDLFFSPSLLISY